MSDVQDRSLFSIKAQELLSSLFMFSFGVPSQKVLLRNVDRRFVSCESCVFVVAPKRAGPELPPSHDGSVF